MSQWIGMRKIIFIFACIYSNAIFAESLEIKINQIEERLDIIEEKIDELLEKKNNSLANLLNELKEDNTISSDEETKNQNDEFKEDLKIDFSVIEIKFKKNNQEFSLYDEYLYLKYKIVNNYNKKIKLIDHSLEVFDLLDERLVALNLEKDFYVSSKKHRILEGSYDVSYSFSGDPKRIKKIKFEDLVFKYNVKKIVFDDNSIINF